MQKGVKQKMIKEKLQSIFREIFDLPDLIISEDMDTNDIEDWDSLSQVLLVEEVQKEFQIEISMDDIFMIHTIGDFIAVIKKYVDEEK